MLSGPSPVSFTQNEDNHRIEVDFVEEIRDQALLKHAAYKQEAARFYNSRVKERTFLLDDLVLKRVTDPTAQGKLHPKWEGPYRVSSVLGLGAYRLATLEDKQLKHAWNADKLRKFYA